MALSDFQQTQLCEIGKDYIDTLRTLIKSVPREVRSEVREAWLAFRDPLDFTNPEEADLAALGALLPVLAFLEETSLEDAREITLLMVLSLLSENLKKD